NATWERSLIGSVVSSCHYLTDLGGSKGAYFIFPDLAIRIEGRFRLKLILSNLARYFLVPAKEVSDTERAAAIVGITVSDPFSSHTVRDWPGAKESSELSKHFADQGIKIPLRRKTRAK
ncbi:velvet factor, partial [Blyttiomyces helicus]